MTKKMLKMMMVMISKVGLGDTNQSGDVIRNLILMGISRQSWHAPIKINHTIHKLIITKLIDIT